MNEMRSFFSAIRRTGGDSSHGRMHGRHNPKWKKRVGVSRNLLLDLHCAFFRKEISLIRVSLFIPEFMWEKREKGGGKELENFHPFFPEN